jgi:hypothetical protein
MPNLNQNQFKRVNVEILENPQGDASEAMHEIGRGEGLLEAASDRYSSREAKKPVRGNPNRPAVKKATKKLEKLAVRPKSFTKQMDAEKALETLKAPVSTSSNQSKKLSKRANQSRIARGQKPF